MARFGLFTKLKRGMELVFTAGFLHTIFIKNLYQITLLNDQVLKFEESSLTSSNITIRIGRFSVQTPLGTHLSFC